MTKEIFEQRLNDVTKLLIDFTKRYCFNDFSSTIKYVVVPNSRDIDSHLDPFEVSLLKKLNNLRSKPLSLKEVSQALYKNGKVPLWINITVYETNRQITIIELCTSRRFRQDHELNHIADQYPPFHPLVPVPPDSLRIEKDGKYDINYQKKFRELMQPEGFMRRIRSFLRKK
jgi:hypothetical protein